MRRRGNAVGPSAVLALCFLAASAWAEGERGLDPSKAMTQYVIDVWNAENGLPQNTVNAILQTRDGYVWFGTYDGLARFDGLRFTVFHKGNTEALRDNGVRSLCEDRDGVLWVGTNGGGLTRFADRRFSHLSPAQGPANDMFWALLADPDGGVWAGTNGGTLYHVKGDTFEARLTSASGESIYAIHRDAAGNLWVGTHGGGLKRLSPDGTWTVYTTREGLPSNFVRAILEDQPGSLWIGTLGGGLARLKDGHITTLSTRDGLPDDVVSALLQDRQGSLWLATRQGLARYRNGVFTTLNETQGLSNDVVYSLYEDSEGSLWVGTGGSGVSRLRDGSVITYGVRDGLSDELVYPIFEDPQGSVWVGTSHGLNQFRDGRWTRYTTGNGLCHDAVRSVWGGTDGDLWVGTYGGGLCRLHEGKWQRYTTKDGLANDSIRAVIGGRDGSIWVGSVGGLSRLNKGKWTTYSTDDGLPSRSIISLIEDRHGTLWVGTDGGGLARFRGVEGFDVFTQKDGLPSNVILALHESDDGALWIGTNGGLARFATGHTAAFTTRDGLPSDSVAQILDDRDGNLWIGSNRGVYRLQKRDLETHGQEGAASLRPLLLGRSDGMRTIQCTAPAQPAGFRTRDGHLWFATSRGVAVLDPHRLRVLAAPPPVVVETVEADDRALALNGGAVVPPGTARLAFRYASLRLIGPENVRFRYRLQGFDESWVEALDRRVAYYTGLGPGAYTFEVTALSGNGAWNTKSASIAVEIRPHLYQTAPFYLTVVLAGVGLVAGTHRLRIGRVEARERELARLVEDRTRKLSEEKAHVEEARAEAERQKRISEEASALKTELLGIAAHDLKNPLQSIMGLAEVLAGREQSGVSEMADVIHRSSRRMLALIDQLLATAALEGKVDLSLATVDLGGLAASVMEDFRPRSERKRQVVSLTVEGSRLARVDEERMREVFENLVGNAVKFTPLGGAIRLSVREDGERISFEVEDEGPGLTPDDLLQLFGRFQRLSARPTGGESSTGLGLYIVKRLVEQHGGRIRAEKGALGRGAKFVVGVPRAGDASAEQGVT